MITPISISLRILALVAIAIVRVFEVLIEAVAEITGIVAREVLGPVARSLATAREKLELQQQKEEEM